MRFLCLIILLLATLMPAAAQDETQDCSGLTPAPLVVGGWAQVTPGQSNNVRDVPSREGARVGQIPGGESFGVLDGPRCADGLVWWQVEYGGFVGWTVDGMDGEQWLMPVAEPAAQIAPAVLSTTVITPENAVQLQPNRSIQCDTGPDYSYLLALGSRHVALNCGFYNINDSDLSLQAQLLADRIGVIDLETGTQMITLSGEGARYVYPVAFLPGERLLWYSQDGANKLLYLSDVLTGELLADAPTTETIATSSGNPSFYANGTRFALFYEDDEGYALQHWDAANLTPLQTQIVEKPEGLTSGDGNGSFAIAPDAARFAVLYAVGIRSELAIYTASSAQAEVIVSVPFEQQINVTYLTFSPSGNFIVGAGCGTYNQFSCAEPAIYWWNAADGALVAEWDVPVNNVGQMRFSPDGDLLVMGTVSGAVLYEVATGEVIHVLPVHASQTLFSSDGTFILTSGDPDTTVWTVGE